ncbi:MAG: hypothetical protein ACTSVZ_13500 [Promethearchaeota archaeon]
MTILEIGLIKNSIMILHQSYYPLKNVKNNLTPERRSQLLSQISLMSQVVLDEEIKVIKNKNLHIYLRNIPAYLKSQFFLYAITDLKSDKNVILNLLDSLFEKFKTTYPDVFSTQIFETSQFQPFREIINEILLDERFSPRDRVINYLF